MNYKLTDQTRLRKKFFSKGFDYADITRDHILDLVRIINNCLYEDQDCLKMIVEMPGKKDLKFSSYKGIDYCFIKVDGPYFKKREAISFNQEFIDGQRFIGFCGWASTNNEKPFLKAFEIWVDQFKK